MRVGRTSSPRRYRWTHLVIGAATVVCWALTAAVPAHAEGSSEHGQAGTISVSGEGTVSASPDVALVRLGVETRSPNVGKAIEAAAGRTKAITRALELDGVAAQDITTVDYNLGFVPASRGRQGSPGGSAGAPADGYYRVTDVAAVTVRELSHLARILGDALSAGANEIQGVSFRIADPAPLEHQARALAFRDARAKAEQIASLAGEKLGPVLRVTVGAAPLPQSGGGLRAAAMAAPSVSPGSLQVRVTLEAVYGIEK